MSTSPSTSGSSNSGACKSWQYYRLAVMVCVPLLFFPSIASCVGAFGPATAAVYNTHNHYGVGHTRQQSRLYIATRDREDATTADDPTTSSLLDIRLEASASSGIRCESELARILETVSSVCEEYGMPLDTSNIQCSQELASQSETIPGVLGRVLLIKIRGMPLDFDDENNEVISQLKIDLAERIDGVLQQQQQQPILLAFQPDDGRNTSNATKSISDAIEKEVLDYGLRDAVEDVCPILDDDISVDSLLTTANGCFIHPYEFEINCFPSSVYEIDGDMVESMESYSSGDGGEQTARHFDTSSILVFDKLLDKNLRRRLLNVVTGLPEGHSSEDDDWDDGENGPDPRRWVRGGLTDVLNDDYDGVEDGDEGSCWGLSHEATMDICFNDYPAISEFESKLSQLFPDFLVSRLPESVLGGCVSPLTANAPTHGDVFEYHIDADPLQVPPSPWADVFGRYPNRNGGKPRFVSCLVYLNDEWDAEVWGAPTRFLDPPTGETIDIFPRPGRCVIMDQDITHTVVAPNVEAGKRPRYSLVWKLILHPTREGQDMDLSCGRKSLFPEPTIVGSANKMEMD